MTLSRDPVTQCDRVLALLRARGETGLNTGEVQELPVADGGRPILRLAARIDNLKARGFVIRSVRQSNGTSTYSLASEPGVEQEVSEPPARADWQAAWQVGIENGERAARDLVRDSQDPTVDLPNAPAEPSGLFDTSQFVRSLGFADSEHAA